MKLTRSVAPPVRLYAPHTPQALFLRRRQGCVFAILGGMFRCEKIEEGLGRDSGDERTFRVGYDSTRRLAVVVFSFFSFRRGALSATNIPSRTLFYRCVQKMRDRTVVAQTKHRHRHSRLGPFHPKTPLRVRVMTAADRLDHSHQTKLDG